MGVLWEAMDTGVWFRAAIYLVCFLSNHLMGALEVSAQGFGTASKGESTDSRKSVLFLKNI